jgi:predicted nicotinamide N-methyase
VSAEAVRDALLREYTRLAPPALVPEIRLHLAIEATPLWQAIEEQYGMAPDAPWWAFAWPGGLALARHVLDQPALVAGRRVFVLAAGSGVEAIACAKAGATEVVACDTDAMARHAIARNAAANGVALEVVGDDPLDGPPPASDLLLAGDVCYERAMAERALRWLRLSARAGVETWLADPDRPYLQKRGLARVAMHVVPTGLEIEGRARRETTIWRVRSRS